MESTSQVPTLPTQDTIVPVKIEILNHHQDAFEVFTIAVFLLAFISCFLCAYSALLKWVAKVMKFKLVVSFE